MSQVYKKHWYILVRPSVQAWNIFLRILQTVELCLKHAQSTKLLALLLYWSYIWNFAKISNIVELSNLQFCSIEIPMLLYMAEDQYIQIISSRTTIWKDTATLQTNEYSMLRECLNTF